MTAPPNVMADVKDWLLNKCRDAGSLLHVSTERLPFHGGRQLTYSSVVVTPDNIPEFTIPIIPDVNMRDGKDSPVDGDGDAQSQASSCCSSSLASYRACGSPNTARHLLSDACTTNANQHSMTQRLLPIPTARSRSAPVSPMRSIAPPGCGATSAASVSSGGELLTSTGGFDDHCNPEAHVLPDHHTNSDPMSLAALSLPHLKMRTQFGFETLSESPHTRRKESLFHDGHIDLPHNLQDSSGNYRSIPFIDRISKRKTSSLSDCAGQNAGGANCDDLENASAATQSGRRHKRRHKVPGGVIAPLGIVLSPNARLSCGRHTASVHGDLSKESTQSSDFSNQHQRSRSEQFCSCPEMDAFAVNPNSTTKAKPRMLLYRRSSLLEDKLDKNASLLAPGDISPCLLQRRNSGSHLLYTSSSSSPCSVAGTLPSHRSGQQQHYYNTDNPTAEPWPAITSGSSHESASSPPLSSTSDASSSSRCSSCWSVSQHGGAGGSADLLLPLCTSDHSTGLGQVRLSLLYLPKQRQLKVGLLRAEHLSSASSRAQHSHTLQRRPSPTTLHEGVISATTTGTGMITSCTCATVTCSSSPPTHDSSLNHYHHHQQLLNPYVKLCLMPGKTQRQVSRIVKQTCNPVFNQDFVFSDLQRHEVFEMRLRLKVYHRANKLGRDEMLGELQVGLAHLIPSQEIRLLRELEPAISRLELGHLHVSVCFYASAEKLTVNVHQVTDLNRHTFTGAPDPYVRVQLSQPRRSPCSKQTKTKKKNTAPVFNESFTFTISPKIEDLNYTCLTFTVLDRSTLRTDGQIGQVRLGYGATEEAEFHHWNQVLQQPGRVATNWHLLMDPVDE